MRLILVLGLCIVSAVIGAGIDHYWAAAVFLLLPQQAQSVEPTTSAHSQKNNAEVLSDRVRCDVRFTALHLADSEYKSFFDRCRGNASGLKAQPNEPFGMETVRLKDGPLVDIWEMVSDKIFQDNSRVITCLKHKTEDCAVVFQLMKVIEEAQQHRGKAMFGHLNRAINLMIKTAPGDWISALDAIDIRVGDCKAYSIAKYFALLEAGVTADNIKLVIVDIQRRSEPHMVVAVRQNETWNILDNRTMVVLTDFEQNTYSPMFVLDDTGVRRYVP